MSESQIRGRVGWFAATCATSGVISAAAEALHFRHDISANSHVSRKPDVGAIARRTLMNAAVATPLLVCWQEVAEYVLQKASVRGRRMRWLIVLLAAAGAEQLVFSRIARILLGKLYRFFEGDDEALRDKLLWKYFGEVVRGDTNVWLPASVALHALVPLRARPCVAKALAIVHPFVVLRWTAAPRAVALPPPLDISDRGAPLRAPTVEEPAPVPVAPITTQKPSSESDISPSAVDSDQSTALPDEGAHTSLWSRLCCRRRPASCASSSVLPDTYEKDIAVPASTTTGELPDQAPSVGSRAGAISSAAAAYRFVDALRELRQAEAVGDDLHGQVGDEVLEQVRRIGGKFEESLSLLTKPLSSYEVFCKSQNPSFEFGGKLADGFMYLDFVNESAPTDLLYAVCARVERGLAKHFDDEFVQGTPLWNRYPYDELWNIQSYRKFLRQGLDDVVFCSVVDALEEPVQAIWIATYTPLLEDVVAGSVLGVRVPPPWTNHQRPPEVLVAHLLRPLPGGGIWQRTVCKIRPGPLIYNILSWTPKAVKRNVIQAQLARQISLFERFIRGHPDIEEKLRDPSRVALYNTLRDRLATVGCRRGAHSADH